MEEIGAEEAETDRETVVERTKGVELTEVLNGVELAMAEDEVAIQITLWKRKWTSGISTSG